jgi:hypothetical protein
MKCLTICQPHALFVCEDPAKLEAMGIEPKRIENRKWRTPYRGPLLIHAGASRKWLTPFKHLPIKPVFSAILGVAELTDIWSRTGRDIPAWVRTHQHTDDIEGMCWWHLTNVRRFKKPIPYSGALGLFEVPDAVVADQLRLVEVALAQG